MTKDNFGTFEIKLPAQNGQAAIAHNSKVKVSLRGLPPSYQVASNRL